MWFTPGTIHRAVNIDRLEVRVVMQNDGLPEAGDAVLTFPREHLANADTYAGVMSLGEGAQADREARGAAQRRWTGSTETPRRWWPTGWTPGRRRGVRRHGRRRCAPASIRTAIVGTGNIARHHAESLRTIAADTGEVELVAAADTDPARIAEFRTEFGIPAGFSDVDALLAECEVDLVDICTPPGAHVPVALSAMTAGSHVVVEKPATLTLSEFDQLVKAEEATDRFVATISQHRFGSGARRLRALHESGAAGRPMLALCDTV